MKILPLESLMDKILNRYNKKPEGWNVLSDQKGNVIVLGPNRGYRLKLIALNPQKYTGVGIEIDDQYDTDRILRGSSSFGFRPLNKLKTQKLLNSVKKGGNQQKLINEFLNIKPLSTKKLIKKRTTAILSGPVISHPDLSLISKSQRELEKKLIIEANKLFRTKYPGRAAIYR